MRRLTILLLASLGCSHHDVCGPDPCPWTQWGMTADHHGATCASAQPPDRLLADVQIDPFTQQEIADDPEGDLVIHYPAPLTECDDVFVELKGGNYRACDPPGSGNPAPCGWQARAQQTWSEARYHWDGSSLNQRWSYQSDWTPPAFPYFEPLFQPALAGGYVYLPGAGGTVLQLDPESGKAVNRFNPFGTSIDPHFTVAGPITANGAGDVLYTALESFESDAGEDARGWLVEISDAGNVTRVGFASLTIGAPRPTDLCDDAFSSSTPAPLPPPSRPPVIPCGSQRPAINAAPAIAADGTIYLVARAHHASHYGYLVGVNPDLSPKWSATLRGRFHDGCGVLAQCSDAGAPGIDPTTNDDPAGMVDDDSSSSPVALADGVVYGALTEYADGRGHLMKFTADGAFAGSYDFGWDLTPAVIAHDGGYSLLVKDNHYDGIGGYFITRLDAALNVEWQAPSTNTQSCVRKGSKVTCTSDHPNGFEWCTNAPAIDGDGVAHVTSEDGNLYAISPDGGLTASYFLQMSQGAAYTPTTLDSSGRVYALNGGHLQVVGAGR